MQHTQFMQDVACHNSEELNFLISNRVRIEQNTMNE
jgi:hypothetical protein